MTNRTLEYGRTNEEATEDLRHNPEEAIAKFISTDYTPSYDPGNLDDQTAKEAWRREMKTLTGQNGRWNEDYDMATDPAAKALAMASEMAWPAKQDLQEIREHLPAAIDAGDARDPAVRQQETWRIRTRDLLAAGEDHLDVAVHLAAIAIMDGRPEDLAKAEAIMESTAEAVRDAVNGTTEGENLIHHVTAPTGTNWPLSGPENHRHADVRHDAVDAAARALAGEDRRLETEARTVLAAKAARHDGDIALLTGQAILATTGHPAAEAAETILDAVCGDRSNAIFGMEMALSYGEVESSHETYGRASEMTALTLAAGLAGERGILDALPAMQYPERGLREAVAEGANEEELEAAAASAAGCIPETDFYADSALGRLANEMRLTAKGEMYRSLIDVLDATTNEETEEALGRFDNALVIGSLSRSEALETIALDAATDPNRPAELSERLAKGFQAVATSGT